MVFQRRATTFVPAGQRIRVLVVDDSVVIRRLVTHALGEDSAFEVAGVASNGSIALQRIPQVNPDVLTLDIEMPEMDGLEALRRVRKDYPDVRVIMFSTLTERGGHYTLEALSLGADDYVTKPANVGSLSESMARLRSELLPRIKQFFQLEAEPAVPAPKTLTASAPSRRPLVGVRREVVTIGVSTGGPNALAAIFPAFPANLSCPILVVQHMPPLFTRLLAERLDSLSSVRVEEATEGSTVEPGKALIAPGNYHMKVKRNGTRVIAALNQGTPENSCRPAADVLFRSVAEVYGPSALAVILTGMGQDGLRGIENLRAKGAFVIAQDKASSVVWGMPGYVVEAGLADVVTGVEGVVPEIMKQV